jgi:hypothetical protein
MIVALAGRRIDASDAEEKHFPLGMECAVYEKITEFFHRHKVTTLVSSAACGADLLAQKAAKKLEIEQHIILPFNRKKFRKTSVIDRPGNWGELFDKICDEVERKGNLLVLENYVANEENAYSEATIELLNCAQSLQSNNEKILAVAVWEERVKNEADETASFISQAQLRNIGVEEILIKF